MTDNLDIQAKGRGWRFTWAREEVWIEVRQWHVHRDDRATAEIQVGTSHEGFGPKLISPTDLNLKAERTREALAKTLAERYPLTTATTPLAAWQGIINEMVEALLHRIRMGNEVETFWGDEPNPAPQWALFPLLPLDQPAALFGDGEAGKSTLALPMILTCMLPWPDNPWGWRPGPTPMRWLWLDWEWSLEDVRWRWACLLRGYDLPPTPLPYRRCDQPLHVEFEGIQWAIEQSEAQGIVVDSLSRACGGELNSSEPASSYFESVAQLRQKGGAPLSILTIAHNAKARDIKERTILGHQTFTTQHRSIWEARKLQEPGDTYLDVGLFHRKKNRSAFFPPQAYRLEWGEDTLTMSRRDAKESFADQLSAFMQVKTALERGPLAVKDISDITGLSEGVVRTTIARRKTSFVKMEGKWGLVVEGATGQEKSLV